MITIRSPYCWAMTLYSVKLTGEELSRYFMDAFRFQAGGRRRRPNLASVFWGLFYVSLLGQEIGWAEHLPNDVKRKAYNASAKK